MAIQVVQPRQVTLRTELAGRTAPYASAEIRPQISGIIRERLFNEGAAVSAGQALYQIEPAPYQATLDQEEGALASAEAAARIAQLQTQRYKTLLPTNAISKQDYDNAEAAYSQAQANVRLHAASVSSARINLQRTRITSPISGRTGRSLVTVGALVSANQTDALTTVSQLDPIYVDVTQSSAELLRLRQASRSGQFKASTADTRQVSLVLEDGSDYPAQGLMQFTEVTVDATTGAVNLRAVFRNTDGILLPGMYVKAIVIEGISENAILVPQQAVVRDRKGNASVRLLDAQNKIVIQDVDASRAIGAEWLVSTGLKAGDRLVVEGAQSAAAGTLVQVVSEPARTAQRH